MIQPRRTNADCLADSEDLTAMHSMKFGKISFLAAISPWFFILPGWMGVPGFG